MRSPDVKTSLAPGDLGRYLSIVDNACIGLTFVALSTYGPTIGKQPVFRHHPPLVGLN